MLVDLTEQFLGDELAESRASEPPPPFLAFGGAEVETVRLSAGEVPGAAAGVIRDGLGAREGEGGGHRAGAGFVLGSGGERGRRGGVHSGGALGELPLFVLDAMTPGQELTLNVFEERYKLMVRRCLQATRRFGMVGLVDERRSNNVGNGSGNGGGGDDGEAVEGRGDDGDEGVRGQRAHHRRGGGVLGLISGLMVWLYTCARRVASVRCTALHCTA